MERGRKEGTLLKWLLISGEAKYYLLKGSLLFAEAETDLLWLNSKKKIDYSMPLTMKWKFVIHSNAIYVSLTLISWNAEFFRIKKNVLPDGNCNIHNTSIEQIALI